MKTACILILLALLTACGGENSPEDRPGVNPVDCAASNVCQQAMGRASSFTAEKAEEICRRIGEGEPLLQICRDPEMPAWRTVYDWLEANDDFAAGFARARARGFDAIAAQCLEIADDSSADFKEKQSPDGQGVTLAFDKEHVQRSKLRIETRLKLLAKWDPKRYGEKLDVTSDGGKLANAVPTFNITLTNE